MDLVVTQVDGDCVHLAGINILLLEEHGLNPRIKEKMTQINGKFLKYKMNAKIGAGFIGIDGEMMKRLSITVGDRIFIR